MCYLGSPCLCIVVLQMPTENQNAHNAAGLLSPPAEPGTSNKPRHYSATTVTWGAQGTTCDLLKGPSSPGMAVWCSQGCRRSHGHGCAEPLRATGTAPSHPMGYARAGLLSSCWCFSGLAASLENKSSQPKQEKVGRNTENSSDIPVCLQQCFQSNRAAEAEPAELPDE